MKCTQCQGKTKVIDSRDDKRRRECLLCGHRFNTMEVEAFGEGSHPSTRSKTTLKAKAKPKPKKKAVRTESGEMKIHTPPTEFFKAAEARTTVVKIEDALEDRALRKLEKEWYDD